MSDELQDEPATEVQKEKLRFFGCTWEEGITKTQADDAMFQCEQQFPQREAEWQMAKLVNEKLELQQTMSVPLPLEHSVQEISNESPQKRGVFNWISQKLEKRKTRIAQAKADRENYIAGIIADLKSGAGRLLERPNFVLQRGEKICWIEPGKLEELKVVGRHYEGASAGMSFRVAKGVRFTVGKHRGRAVSETAAVTTSRGELVITNKRLAFLGDEKSFAIKLEKLLEIHPALYGLKISDGSKSGSKLIRYCNVRNGDIVCEVLNFVLEDKS